MAKKPSLSLLNILGIVSLVVFGVGVTISSQPGSIFWQDSTWRMTLAFYIIFYLFAPLEFLYLVLKHGIGTTKKEISRLRRKGQIRPLLGKILMVLNSGLLLGLAVLLFGGYRNVPRLISDLQTGSDMYVGSCTAKRVIHSGRWRDNYFYISLEDKAGLAVQISIDDFVKLTGRKDILRITAPEIVLPCNYNVKVRYLKGRGIALHVDVLETNPSARP